MSRRETFFPLCCVFGGQFNFPPFFAVFCLRRDSPGIGLGPFSVVKVDVGPRSQRRPFLLSRAQTFSSAKKLSTKRGSPLFWACYQTKQLQRWRCSPCCEEKAARESRGQHTTIILTHLLVPPFLSHFCRGSVALSLPVRRFVTCQHQEHQSCCTMSYGGAAGIREKLLGSMGIGI